MYGQHTSAFDSESLTVAASSVGFTSATYAPSGEPPAQKVVFYVETAQVRYWTDGSAPTASVGIIADVGDIIAVEGSSDIAGFRAIRTGGTSGVLRTIFER